MSKLTITSTTDTPEQIKAAIGDEGQGEDVVEQKSAVAGETAEATETEKESDLSEEGEKEGLEASDESEESGDEESESDEEEKPQKKRPGFKKRIDKLTRRLSERDREIEYWKGKALKGETDDVPQAKPVREESKDVKPTPDEFETHEEYVEALTDWRVSQHAKTLEMKQRESQVKSEFDRKMNDHLGRVKTFKEAHSDFEELIEDIADIPMSPAVHELILESDNGPELMYELAKDPDQYARICEMSPLSAARAIERIDLKIKSKSSEEKVIKKTKAPAPITPITSRNASATRKTIFDEGLSQRDYERMMEEREKRRASSW
jgi:hypothetical protein